jgi:hypothetical protein
MSELEELKERLQKVETENARLRYALEVVDRDIDRAALRFLKSTVPHGKLKFSSFLELLELEMRRRYMDNRATPEGFKSYVTDTVWKLMHEKIDQVVAEMMPKLKGEVSNYVKLPVVIKKVMRMGTERKKLMYQALSVKGMVKNGLGESPEAAYADLRDRLVVLIKTNPVFALVRDPMSMAIFNKSKAFAKEELEGWTLEARLWG